jgi:hypothetical protein
LEFSVLKRFAAVALILTSTAFAQAQECSIVKLKPIGRTYKVEEVDLYALIMERLKQVDWSSVNRKMKEKILSYRPENSLELQQAERHAVRYYDPTFILPIDVRDAEGNLLYAKGTAVNPLERVSEAVWKNRVYLFFNLQDGCQRKFVRDYLKKNGQKKLVILIADGHSNLKEITDFIKEIGYPVYALTDLVAQRFGVDKSLSIVSFVRKDGRALVRIEELPDKELEVCREKD